MQIVCWWGRGKQEQTSNVTRKKKKKRDFCQLNNGHSYANMKRRAFAEKTPTIQILWMIQLSFLKSLHIPITLFQCRNFGLGTLTLPADVRGWCSSRRRLTAYTHKRNPKQQDGRNSSCEQTTRTALSIVQGKSYQLIRACDIIKCFTPVFSFSFLDIDVPITTACVQMFEPQKAAILLPSATNTSSKHNETKH